MQRPGDGLDKRLAVGRVLLVGDELAGDQDRDPIDLVLLIDRDETEHVEATALVGEPDRVSDLVAIDGRGGHGHRQGENQE